MENNKLKLILRAEFDRPLLVRYILFAGLLVWFFIALAYIAYPASEYSILEHTFSYLGSFDEDRNPEGWYFFSIALFCAAIVFAPLMIYRNRRIRIIEPISGYLILILELIGCIGIFLVGVFPYTGMDYFQDLENRQMHNLVSIFAFGGYGLGIIWESLLMGKDRFAKWPLSFGKGGQKKLDHTKLQYPYIIFFAIVFLTGGFLGGWEIYYPIVHAQDPSIGHWPGIGPFAFPLWEWILIVYLFVFFYWTSLVLPEKVEI